MTWFAISPRDPADPRWPLPETPRITLKAENADDARRRFEEAYPSKPFGTPGHPTGDVGPGSFRGDAEALVVEETDTPPTPEA
ncbi:MULTISPECIES: hypothetical protein [Methylorubrum]|uniref:hypothetical protein n=1 Tax=Methylorubrum TaxID=2282523 RepID=UPI0020A0BC25|nr:MULTISPECIES: hypothetical protein [Methylorubrum]MCP1548957.1 hypothetical protein [Methylorubrum zatmanii]MCP1554430.1 hypothetical protein [Methylorubrum extorquens]MCP1579259.1 hypothetical protein [Methylorubrum extorquens]